MRAYNQSAATLNLLRGFSTGGYAGLDRIAQWNLDFMANSDEGKAYMDLVGGGMAHQDRTGQGRTGHTPIGWHDMTSCMCCLRGM